MSEKVNMGGPTEDAVQQLVEMAFTPFFVCRSPRRDSDGKEVTDVLVAIEDVCLVIQVGSQAVSESSESQESDLGWARKSLDKKARQIAGAVRCIDQGRITTVENQMRGQVPFDKNDHPYRYGLVVLHHRSDPYDPLELSPAVAALNIPVHVFSYRDFHELVKRLDTPWDLINYLELRSDVLIPLLKPKVHEEEATCRQYMERMEELVALRQRKRGDSHDPCQTRKYADSMRSILSRMNPDAKLGLIIDGAVYSAEQISLRSLTGQIEKANANLDAATELARLTRPRRILMGKLLQTASDASLLSGKCELRFTYSRINDVCFVLMAAPASIHGTAASKATLLAHMLDHVDHHDAKTCVGLVVEAGNVIDGHYELAFIHR